MLLPGCTFFVMIRLSGFSFGMPRGECSGSMLDLEFGPTCLVERKPNRTHYILRRVVISWVGGWDDDTLMI